MFPFILLLFLIQLAFDNYYSVNAASSARFNNNRPPASGVSTSGHRSSTTGQPPNIIRSHSPLYRQSIATRTKSPQRQTPTQQVPNYLVKSSPARYYSESPPATSFDDGSASGSVNMLTTNPARPGGYMSPPLTSRQITNNPGLSLVRQSTTAVPSRNGRQSTSPRREGNVSPPRVVQFTTVLGKKSGSVTPGLPLPMPFPQPPLSTSYSPAQPSQQAKRSDVSPIGVRKISPSKYRIVSQSQRNRVAAHQKAATAAANHRTTPNVSPRKRDDTPFPFSSFSFGTTSSNGQNKRNLSPSPIGSANTPMPTTIVVDPSRSPQFGTRTPLATPDPGYRSPLRSAFSSVQPGSQARSTPALLSYTDAQNQKRKSHSATIPMPGPNGSITGNGRSKSQPNIQTVNGLQSSSNTPLPFGAFSSLSSTANAVQRQSTSNSINAPRPRPTLPPKLGSSPEETTNTIVPTRFAFQPEFNPSLPTSTTVLRRGENPLVSAAEAPPRERGVLEVGGSVNRLKDALIQDIREKLIPHLQDLNQAQLLLNQQQHQVNIRPPPPQTQIQIVAYDSQARSSTDEAPRSTTPAYSDVLTDPDAYDRGFPINVPSPLPSDVSNTAPPTLLGEASPCGQIDCGEVDLGSPRSIEITPRREEVNTDRDIDSRDITPSQDHRDIKSPHSSPTQSPPTPINVRLASQMRLETVNNGASSSSNTEAAAVGAPQNIELNLTPRDLAQSPSKYSDYSTVTLLAGAQPQSKASPSETGSSPTRMLNQSQDLAHEAQELQRLITQEEADTEARERQLQTTTLITSKGITLIEPPKVSKRLAAVYFGNQNGNGGSIRNGSPTGSGPKQYISLSPPILHGVSNLNLANLAQPLQNYGSIGNPLTPRSASITPRGSLGVPIGEHRRSYGVPSQRTRSPTGNPQENTSSSSGSATTDGNNTRYINLNQFQNLHNVFRQSSLPMGVQSVPMATPISTAIPVITTPTVPFTASSVDPNNRPLTPRGFSVQPVTTAVQVQLSPAVQHQQQLLSHTSSPGQQRQISPGQQRHVSPARREVPTPAPRSGTFPQLDGSSNAMSRLIAQFGRASVSPRQSVNHRGLLMSI